MGHNPKWCVLCKSGEHVSLADEESAAFKVGSAESRNAGADIPGAAADGAAMARQARMRLAGVGGDLPPDILAAGLRDDSDH